MCEDCKDSKPYTKEEFEALKERLESKGYTVISKWRKGLKHVKLGDIVLSKGV